MTSGVYFIRNVINDNTYIGSSSDVRKRWSVHKSLLNAGKHPNERLQFDWDKYGGGWFWFGVLEECDPTQLMIAEQWHMDNSEDPYLYNIYRAVA